MKKTTDSFIERLQGIIESSKIEDFEYWDKNTILEENRTETEIKQDRMQQLKEQGVTHPIHKYNQVTYGKEKT